MAGSEAEELLNGQSMASSTQLVHKASPGSIPQHEQLVRYGAASASGNAAAAAAGVTGNDGTPSPARTGTLPAQQPSAAAALPPPTPAQAGPLADVGTAPMPPSDDLSGDASDEAEALLPGRQCDEGGSGGGGDRHSNGSGSAPDCDRAAATTSYFQIESTTRNPLAEQLPLQAGTSRGKQVQDWH